jgi:hypothetical protein
LTLIKTFYAVDQQGDPARPQGDRIDHFSNLEMVHHARGRCCAFIPLGRDSASQTLRRQGVAVDCSAWPSCLPRWRGASLKRDLGKAA